MSLFKEADINKIVLSASRMTDMPKFYPLDIINEVNKRINLGQQIHSFVLWTKHPISLLSNPLHDFLLSLKKIQVQLFIQLTISGLGGLIVGEKLNGDSIILEPNVPSYMDSLAALPEIISLVENPERIKLRIDPIIRIKDSKGNIFSSMKYLPLIVKMASQIGIKNFAFSFLEKGMHKKVDKRFYKIKCEILSPNDEERKLTGIWLKKIEEEFKVIISACCVPGFNNSKCIDGNLLQKLHESNEPADISQPFRREKCGCTTSIDIGGWPPKKCYSGCIYCYANSSAVS